MFKDLGQNQKRRKVGQGTGADVAERQGGRFFRRLNYAVRNQEFKAVKEESGSMKKMDVEVDSN